MFDGYAASPDFIQAYIFPGGMLIHEPPSPLAGEPGLSWEDRAGVRARLCRNAQALAAALRRAAARRA